MKPLICEMCNSNDVVKQDGLFVCQHCGTKYSVEEAKKIMLGGPVVIDETPKINNYYELAESSAQSGNNAETEKYCNKILEIEPSQYKAWLLKGIAVGWQSTIEHSRIDESIICFEKVLSNSPQEEQEELKSKIIKELNTLSLSFIQACCDNFEKNLSMDCANTILQKLDLISSYSLAMDKFGASATDFKRCIALKIQMSAILTLNTNSQIYNNSKVNENYGHDFNEYYSYDKFIILSDAVIMLLRNAMIFSNYHDKTTYDNMIAINTTVCNSHYQQYISTNAGGYNTLASRSYDEIKNRIDNIMLWHQEIKKIDPTYIIPKPPKIHGHGYAYYIKFKKIKK